MQSLKGTAVKTNEMDTRLESVIREESIALLCELQDEIGILFAWRLAHQANEVTLSSEVIQQIINHIKTTTIREES